MCPRSVNEGQTPPSMIHPLEQSFSMLYSRWIFILFPIYLLMDQEDVGSAGEITHSNVDGDYMRSGKRSCSRLIIKSP